MMLQALGALLQATWHAGVPSLAQARLGCCPCTVLATRAHATLQQYSYIAQPIILGVQSCGPSCVSEQVVSEVGEEKVRSWEELGDEQSQYQALLSDYCWGINAVVVNEFVQEYLFSLWDVRQLVICGQTASNGTGLHGREATSTAQ